MRLEPTVPTLPEVPPSTTTANLRRLGARARVAIGVRDDAIRAARAQGMSLREIGDAVGLSHTAVANIVNRSRQETP